MATVKLSDCLAQRVAALGVTHVFMVTSGGAMHLDDSFGSREDISFVCCHHEQACAMAVEGYARTRGGIGCAVVTSGPGGTNTLTGVLGQWHDSVPALYLHAQDGCTNSPENPTVVLGLVGAAGALFSTVRARLKDRRNSSNK